jgi:hypothetical protein
MFILYVLLVVLFVMIADEAIAYIRAKVAGRGYRF